MKFKEKDKIVYCKDNYNKKFDNGEGYYNIGVPHYYKGYLIHKEDGPAIIHNSGNKEWYIEGRRHRINRSAIEFSNGTKSWFLNGIKYSEDEYWKVLNIKKKRKILDEI